MATHFHSPRGWPAVPVYHHCQVSQDMGLSVLEVRTILGKLGRLVFMEVRARAVTRCSVNVLSEDSHTQTQQPPACTALPVPWLQSPNQG